VCALVATFAGLLVFAAVAAGPAAAAPVTPFSAPGTATVSVSPNVANVAVSGTVSFTATVTDANGPVVGDTVTFSSDGSQIITQQSTTTDAEGQVTATVQATNDPGSFTITATDTTSLDLLLMPTTGTATLNQSVPQNISVTPASASGIPNGPLVAETATVTDGSNVPLEGDTVTFSSAQGVYFAPASPEITDDNGQIVVQVGATSAGSFTLTAADSFTSGTATLLEQPGPPDSLSVALTPTNSLVADGSSTTNAIATVRDQYLNPVPGDTVTFTSSGGQALTPTSATTGADGRVGVQVRATLTPGTYSVSAGDGVATHITPATLTQTPWVPTHLGLALFPATLTADGSSPGTAIVSLTDAQGRPRSGDAGAISISSSDPGVRFGGVTDNGNGSYTIPLAASTTAHAVTITATAGGLSASQTLNQIRGPARTVSLQLSPPVLHADGLSTTTATVRVVDATGNPAAGDVLRLYTNTAGVHVTSFRSENNGTYTGTLTSSNMPATVSVFATDYSTSPQVSGEATLTEIPAPSLLAVATMQWSFFFTPRYTVVRGLRVSGAPVGGTVQLLCHGGGCPFARRLLVVAKRKPCKRPKKGHKQTCKPTGTYDLGAMLDARHIRAGSRVIVEIRRRGYIGKYYRFTLRSGRAPRVTISCLAPGATQPGVGCRSA
jgi:adhesin/invasin